MVPACLMNRPTKKLRFQGFILRLMLDLIDIKPERKKKCNTRHVLLFMPSQPLVVEIEVIVLLIFEELSAKVKKYLNN